MESMAPTKAAPISAAELAARPRLSREIMTRDTTSLAPEEMANTKGPAMGLAKKVWRRKPETDSPPPRMTAAQMRGRRSVRTMPNSVLPSEGLKRMRRISAPERDTLPALMFQTTRSARRTNSKKKELQ